MEHRIGAESTGYLYRSTMMGNVYFSGVVLKSGVYMSFPGFWRIFIDFIPKYSYRKWRRIVLNYRILCLKKNTMTRISIPRFTRGGNDATAANRQ